MKKTRKIFIFLSVMLITCLFALSANAAAKLSAPVLTASNVESTGKIRLTWNAVDGAEKYQIYRSTEKSGTYTLLSTTANTSATNSKVNTGDKYYYYIVTVDSDGNTSAKSNIVSCTCDLPRPTGVKSSNIASTGKIKVTWNAVEGASKYYLYRSLSKDGTYEFLNGTTKTEFINSGTEAGKTYYYKVRAVHSDSTANSAQSGYTSRTCDLPAPTGLTSANVASTGKIRLSWNAVEGADKYYIYRSLSKDGTYEYLAATTKTTATNTKAVAGTKYYYRVKAVCSSNTAANSGMSGYTSRTCDLPRPTGVKSSNIASTGKIKVTWNAVEGASKYYLYRSLSKDGTYEFLNGTTKTEFINSGTEAGKTYYYRVSAVHADSAANSAQSGYTSRTCDLPAPKVTLSNVESTGKIKISWDAVDGAVKYQIYRSATEDGSYSLLVTTTKTSAVNTKISTGETYWYKVRAIASASAANSSFSTAKSRICDLPRPTGFTASNIASTGKIKLNWDAVDGADKYYIYRSLSKDGTYEFLNGTTKTEFINSGTDAGTTYYYKLRAVCADSSANSAQTAYISCCCDLAMPKLAIGVDEATGNTTLSWEAVDGAVSYEVYRCEADGEDSYSVIGTVTDTSFTDTTAVAGESCLYKIRALSSNSDAHSAFSDAKQTLTKLAAPVVTISKNENGKPVLSWEKQEGAVGYDIYRAVIKTGTYSHIYTSTSGSFTNSGALDGVEYFYKIKAVGAIDAYTSDYSNIVSTVAGNNTTETFVTSYVLTDTAYLRKEPANEAESIILKYMDEVQVGSNVVETDDGTWTRVKYNNGLYYIWIPADEPKFTTEKSSFEYTSSTNSNLQNDVLEFAVKYIYEPTYYAHEQSDGVIDEATGKYGFDCSGFVGYVFNTVLSKYNPLYEVSKTITTMYETEVLYNSGFNNQYTVEEVALSDIQPGDVIFFKLDKTDPKVMDHCGIYLGNNEFIHASYFHDCICIMPYTDSYLENTVAIKRYFPEEIKPIDQTVVTNYDWVYIYPEMNADKETALYSFQLGEEATMLYNGRSENWCYVRSKTGVEGYALQYRFDLP